MPSDVLFELQNSVDFFVAQSRASDGGYCEDMHEESRNSPRVVGVNDSSEKAQHKGVPVCNGNLERELSIDFI